MTNQLIISTLVLATIFGVSFSTQVACSQETDKPNPDHMLHGGVKGAALRTEDGLQKIGDAVKDVKRASQGLMGEVTRKNTVVMRGPNVVGSTVIPGMPMATGGVMPFGDLPARRKQVSLFMAQLDRSLGLMQNEVAALIIPEDKGEAVVTQWNQVREEMAGVEKNFDALKELTKNPNYDTNKIGKRALGIYDGMGRVEKLRRQVVKSLSSK